MTVRKKDRKQENWNHSWRAQLPSECFTKKTLPLQNGNLA